MLWIACQRVTARDSVTDPIHQATKANAWHGADARPWTRQEESDLVAARDAGQSWNHIAITLNRPSGPACRGRYELLRDRAASAADAATQDAARSLHAKSRMCLRCLSPGGFASEWAGHRICPVCTEAEAEPDTSVWPSSLRRAARSQMRP
jgi:hypothetical protein